MQASAAVQTTVPMSSLASPQLSTSPVVSSFAGTSGDLPSSTIHLLSSGAGFQALQHPRTRPNDLGRASIVVPSFVDTFPLPSVVSSSSPCMLSTASVSPHAYIPSIPAPPAPV